MPSAAVPMTEVPWGPIIAVVSLAFTAFGAVLGYLMKALHKSAQKNTEQKFSHVMNEVGHVSADVVKLDKRVAGYFKAHDRLRDKWEDFLKRNFEADQRVRALFSTMDRLQIAIDTIPATLDSKIETEFSVILDELQKTREESDE